MTDIDLVFDYDDGRGRFLFDHYDCDGYPCFRGHHSTNGSFTVTYEPYDEDEGFWIYNRLIAFPITQEAFKWRPFIPDDYLHGMILSQLVGLIRGYNDQFQGRWVPGSWSNVCKLNQKGRKRISDIYKPIKIWGWRKKMTIPEEIFFLIMSFTSILIPLE
jgi:hypothetical protein